MTSSREEITVSNSTTASSSSLEGNVEEEENELDNVSSEDYLPLIQQRENLPPVAPRGGAPFSSFTQRRNVLQGNRVSTTSFPHQKQPSDCEADESGSPMTLFKFAAIAAEIAVSLRSYVAPDAPIIEVSNPDTDHPSPGTSNTFISALRDVQDAILGLRDATKQGSQHKLECVHEPPSESPWKEKYESLLAHSKIIAGDELKELVTNLRSSVAPREQRKITDAEVRMDEVLKNEKCSSFIPLYEELQSLRAQVRSQQKTDLQHVLLASNLLFQQLQKEMTVSLPMGLAAEGRKIICDTPFTAPSIIQQRMVKLQELWGQYHELKAHLKTEWKSMIVQKTPFSQQIFTPPLVASSSVDSRSQLVQHYQQESARWKRLYEEQCSSRSSVDAVPVELVPLRISQCSSDQSVIETSVVVKHLQAEEKRKREALQSKLSSLLKCSVTIEPQGNIRTSLAVRFTDWSDPSCAVTLNEDVGSKVQNDVRNFILHRMTQQNESRTKGELENPVVKKIPLAPSLSAPVSEECGNVVGEQLFATNPFSDDDDDKRESPPDVEKQPSPVSLLVNESQQQSLEICSQSVLKALQNEEAASVVPPVDGVVEVDPQTRQQKRRSRSPSSVGKTKGEEEPVRAHRRLEVDGDGHAATSMAQELQQDRDVGDRSGDEAEQHSFFESNLEDL